MTRGKSSTDNDQHHTPHTGGDDQGGWDDLRALKFGPNSASNAQCQRAWGAIHSRANTRENGTSECEFSSPSRLATYEAALTWAIFAGYFSCEQQNEKRGGINAPFRFLFVSNIYGATHLLKDRVDVGVLLEARRRHRLLEK